MALDGVGIKFEYPRLPLAQKTRSLLAAARPFTWAAVLVGFAAAAAMMVGYGYQSWHGLRVEWKTLVGAAATLLGVQIASNWQNLATDTVEDKINRPFRPSVSGHLSPELLSSLSHILWLLCVLRAATINAAFGVLVLAIVGISYLYSAPPARTKRVPWSGNVSIALARGLLGIVAAWSAIAPWNAPQPWVAGGILMVFLLGAATSKDFSDEAGDRAAGVHTLVVRYGARTASWMSLPFALTPILTVPLARKAGWIEFHPLAYLGMSMVVLWFAWSLVFRTHIQNRILESTKVWAAHYFSLLGILGCLASVAIP